MVGRIKGIESSSKMLCDPLVSQADSKNRDSPFYRSTYQFRNPLLSRTSRSRGKKQKIRFLIIQHLMWKS